MFDFRVLMCLLLAAISVSCSDINPGAEDYGLARQRMVDLIRSRGVSDEIVLDALARVDRHRFIPERYRSISDPYGDHPCPIGQGQTISQPYIVAYMTAALDVAEGDRVLELGTGSGYQAAVLAELGLRVFTIEIVPELAEHARRVLEAEGYDNVELRLGDGYGGWAEHAPFDAIIVTCAPDRVPEALAEQLAEGGRMVIPVGVDVQRLILLEKLDGELVERSDLPVRFVPMVRGE